MECGVLAGRTKHITQGTSSTEGSRGGGGGGETALFLTAPLLPGCQKSPALTDQHHGMEVSTGLGGQSFVSSSVKSKL